MNEYSVYEIDGDNRRSFIATIAAENDEEALQLAQDEYGAPIAVVPE